MIYGNPAHVKVKFGQSLFLIHATKISGLGIYGGTISVTCNNAIYRNKKLQFWSRSVFRNYVSNETKCTNVQYGLKIVILTHNINMACEWKHAYNWTTKRWTTIKGLNILFKTSLKISPIANYDTKKIILLWLSFRSGFWQNRDIKNWRLLEMSGKHVNWKCNEKEGWFYSLYAHGVIYRLFLNIFGAGHISLSVY